MLLDKLMAKKRTLIMGVLNVTPDSFSDGGMFMTTDRAVAHGEALCAAGADIIDVGGVSTRPFADPVSADEEIARVIPVIERLSNCVSIPVSVDTSRAGTARRAIDAGASIINDIAALRFDPLLGDVAAEADLPVILMHMQGTPQTMQIKPAYDDVVGEIIDFLSDSIDFATGKGIRRENIIIDPGIGFGKRVEHNLTIIRELSRLNSIERPILVGASRKSFIGEVTGIKDPSARDTATLAVTALCVANGADIVRVHDVKGSIQVVRMAEAIRNASPNFRESQYRFPHK